MHTGLPYIESMNSKTIQDWRIAFFTHYYFSFQRSAVCRDDKPERCIILFSKISLWISESFQEVDESSSLADSLGLQGCITSAKTGFNVNHVFEMCTLAALDRTKINTVIKKLRRPTSLKLEDNGGKPGGGGGDPVLRTISQKQRQLRLGISSLILKKTDAPNISRNTTCPSPFSPYSPHARNSMLAVNALRPVPEQRPQSAQSAQIQPNRLSCRPSRPSSRAQPRPVPPPTSPSCDNPSACYSPTSSLMSGPLSPTSSVLSPFQPASLQSPFQPMSDSSIAPSPFPASSEGPSPFPAPSDGSSPLLPNSDRDSISSHSQTDSISVR